MPVRGKFHRGLGRIHQEPALHLDGFIRVILAKHPVARDPAVGVENAAMVGQGVRCQRRAIARDVVGAGHGDGADLAQFARFQRQHLRGADADGQINAVGGEIDKAIGQAQVAVQIGVACGKAAQHWGDVEFAKGDGGRDADRSTIPFGPFGKARE